jgi:hypothetical protein
MISRKSYRAVFRGCFLMATLAASQTYGQLSSTDMEIRDSTVTRTPAAPAADAPIDKGEARPPRSGITGAVSEEPGFFSRFLPRSLAIGPQAGFTGARFRSSREYAAYTEPTPASQQAWTAPSYGILATIRWNNGATLSLAPRHETYGISTREETVSFKDNPFPHTLRASTELTYNVWPLLLGWGWFGGRQHAQLQVGRYVAFIDDIRTEWTVDGEKYGNVPHVVVKSSHSGWLLGTEYGYRLGAGEVLMGMEVQQSSESIMAGLDGEIIANTVRIQVAYLWTLAGR